MAALIISCIETRVYMYAYIFSVGFFSYIYAWKLNVLLKTFTFCFAGNSYAKGWKCQVTPTDQPFGCGDQGKPHDEVPSDKPAPCAGSAPVTPSHCGSCPGPAGLLGHSILQYRHKDTHLRFANLYCQSANLA